MSVFGKIRSVLTKPVALGVAGAAGMLLGVAGWGGFNTAMEATNSLEFCTSCHEMRDNVYQEYKKTIHYSNPAGVRAICSDCHVPKDWTHKIIRKVQASQELWGKVTGSIETPEKFEAKRLELAKHEWARMKASDSRECRNCHSFEAMDFEHQKKKEASDQMQKAWKEGGTCIDCHKGIAHKLPDMATGYKSLFEALEAASKTVEASIGTTLYPISSKSFWLEKPADASAPAAGKLLVATPLKVLATDGQWLQVGFAGWQQEGAERMFYEQQGKRIFAAALTPAAVAKVEKKSSMVDADTGQKWTEATLVGWVQATELTPDLRKLWQYGSEMFSASCALCHSLPPSKHYLANQWIGVLNSMKRNVSLDDEQYRLLQKYVQMNAQDTSSTSHE